MATFTLFISLSKRSSPVVVAWFEGSLMITVAERKYTNGVLAYWNHAMLPQITTDRRNHFHFEAR